MAMLEQVGQRLSAIAILQPEPDGWHVTIKQGSFRRYDVRGLPDLASAEHAVVVWRESQGVPVPCIIEIGVEDPVS